MKDGKPSNKQQTRERIIDAATKLFLRQGYHATGVDKVMADANLTAGGFYSHFTSKDDLLAEAFDLACQKLDERLDDGAPSDAGRFIESYLSSTHRDDASNGCPFAAIGAEMSRAPEPVRGRAGNALNNVLSDLKVKAGLDQDQATALFALCVGGVVLSRLAATAEESERVLEDCRHAAQAIASPESA